MAENPSTLVEPGISVRIRQLPHCVKIPTYATPGANGLDIYTAQDVLIGEGAVASVPTGFCLELPQGHAALILPRSSTFNKGLDISGFIDSDYRGEVFVQVNNTSGDMVFVRRGERISQLVLVETPRVHWHEVKELSVTSRGCGGFGHTGR